MWFLTLRLKVGTRFPCAIACRNRWKTVAPAPRHCLPDTSTLPETGKQCYGFTESELLPGKQWHTRFTGPASQSGALGPYLVVADPNRFGRKPGTLAIFRVFDDARRLLPDSKWELAGRVSANALRGANRLQVQGNHAFVDGSCSPKVRRGRPMAEGSVVDLTDPANPRVVAAVDFPDVRGPNGLTIAGSVWFLAGGQTVQAYDIGAPSRPRLLVSFKSAKAFPSPDDNANDLVYRDGYLYVTSQGDHGLVILRVVDEKIVQLASKR